tara:strand:- start:9753 stop:10991 length:1239 start_codon:yes stop_codon:yes gene_type:complete
MLAKFKPVTSCRACQSTELEKVLDFGLSAIADDYFIDRDNSAKYPLACFLCNSCGLLQLDHVVDPSAIYDDYIYWSTSSPGLDEHFKQYADSVYTFLELSDTSLVMDIGCNDGMLLRHFRHKGCRVLGIEPSTQIAQHANEDGLAVINNYWNLSTAEEVKQRYRSIDLVTANNVFANVDDIYNFAKSVPYVLAEEGVFVIETGSHLSLIENFVFDNIYHEHLSYFSVSALQHFFKQFNMEIFHVEQVNTKGGSIRVFACLSTSQHTIDSSVGIAIAQEQKAGLFQLKTYKEYISRIYELKQNVHAYLAKAQEDGKSIIGFGASATVTTVLHTLDIGDFFTFLVDDNESKQNTFSPGYHIPVKPTKAMYINGPCCVIVLPWRFADMFISNNHHFMNVERSIVKIIPHISEVTE